MEVVEKPVTWRAVQYTNDESVCFIEAELRGTGVRLEMGYVALNITWSDQYPFARRRESESVWIGEWVVVGSNGTVRLLSDTQMRKEFVV